MRLFIAIDLPEDLKQFLEDMNSAFENFKGIKRIYKGNVHLTLLFLGDYKEPKKVADSLKKIKFQKFILKTENFGFFPNEQRINVAWMGINQHEELISLQNKIAELFKNNLQYMPHVSFARIKYFKPLEKDAFLEILKNYSSKTFEFEVDRFKLYSSELTKIGPIHRVLNTFPAIEKV